MALFAAAGVMFQLAWVLLLLLFGLLLLVFKLSSSGTGPLWLSIGSLRPWQSTSPAASHVYIGATGDDDGTTSSISRIRSLYATGDDDDGTTRSSISRILSRSLQPFSWMDDPDNHHTPRPFSYDDLVEWLVDEGISTVDAFLSSPDSPQHLAATWLAEEDSAALELTSDHLIQRYVLATLFFAMGGRTWANSLNFLMHEHECDWHVTAFAGDRKTLRDYGATCSDDTSTASDMAGGIVNSLYFPSNFLVGSFPAELAHLTGLEVIHVFNNANITEPAGYPAAFRGLTNLRYIGLHYCQLEGTLPDWLGDDLTSLTTLVLSNNQFQGSLPASISNLVNLEQLYLDDNYYLEVNITLLGGLTQLRHLILEQTIVVGGGESSSSTLDDALVSNWEQLEILDLSDCNISSSTIPSSLWQLDNLRILDLHANHFYGDLSSSIGTNVGSALQLLALELLALNFNDLSGPLPTALSQFARLTQLDLSGNRFTGTLPGTWGTTSYGLGLRYSLEILFLAENPLLDPAPIPSFLQQMTNLVELSLRNTSRTGEIPTWIGEDFLPRVRLLDLHGNELVGSIPTSLGSLNYLKMLFLSHNQLAGTIPWALSAIQGSLDYLFLESNNLQGSAAPVCNDSFDRDFFVADCDEIDCACCDVCCVDGDDTCNTDQSWLVDADPIWELRYRREWPDGLDHSSGIYVPLTGDVLP